MNNKMKQLTLAICSSVICASAIAQTAAPTPPIVVPINSNIGVGIQAPFLLGMAAANKARNDANNAANAESQPASVNNVETSASEVKPQQPSVQSETEQEKAIRAAVLAKDTAIEDTNKTNAAANSTQPKSKVEAQQNERMTGQVPINNRIIRTNDIRIWNDSSIREKEEVGQKNILQALEGK